MTVVAVTALREALERRLGAATTSMVAVRGGRVALHQIAPLVVHAVTFGGSYRPAAEAAIARYR